jgi:hypothetical protein
VCVHTGAHLEYRVSLPEQLEQALLGALVHGPPHAHRIPDRVLKSTQVGLTEDAVGGS